MQFRCWWRVFISTRETKSSIQVSFAWHTLTPEHVFQWRLQRECGGCDRTPLALAKFVSKASLACFSPTINALQIQYYSLHPTSHWNTDDNHTLYWQTHRWQSYAVLTNTQVTIIHSTDKHADDNHTLYWQTHRRQSYTVLTNTQQWGGIRCPPRALTNIPHPPPFKNSWIRHWCIRRISGIIRPHRIRDVDYCGRWSRVSVMRLRCASVAERIEVLLDVETGPWEHCIRTRIQISRTDSTFQLMVIWRRCY